MNRPLLTLLIAVAPAVLMAQIPEYVPSEGLEFWSDFDGDAENESLQSVSSSIYGAQPTANRNGEANKALTFDGQNDYVLLYGEEGGISFGESLTMAAWVRPASSILNGTHSRIFNSTEGVGGGPDRWLFTWSPPEHEEKMQFQVDPSGSNGPYGSTPLTVGEWSHVAMVFDQGQVSFYHNGVADGSATIANNSLAHVMAPIQIGSANGNSFFHGDLDNIGIWSQALSPEQIQGLSDESVPQSDPIEDMELGCELFNIQELAMQNLTLMDSITTLNAIINGTAGNAQDWSCGDDFNYQEYSYRTVQIGSQCWFAENLRVTEYLDGTTIPEVDDGGEWTTTSSGAWCYPNNDPYYVSSHGRLYNWFATDASHGICPTGWHVPHDEEWIQLEMELGMSESEAYSNGNRGTDQGSILKAASGWLNNGNGTDEYEFSVVPSGYRAHNDWGYFSQFGNLCRFWTSTDIYGAGSSRDRTFYGGLTSIARTSMRHNGGGAIRCIKDQ